MNDSERNEPLPYDHHFESFDYYTDFSETPESITSSSQFTNNDCMMNNNASETDNNNNIDGTANNSHKNNPKEKTNHRANDAADSKWSAAMAITSTTTSTTTPTTITTSKEAAVVAPGNVACADSRDEHSVSESKVSNDNEHTKKNDLPPATTVNKSPAKLHANKKNAKSKKVRTK